MTKVDAKKQLNYGYILFIAGVLFGILIHKSFGESLITSVFIWGYFFWATYWGYKIMYSKFASFFNAPILIEVKNSYDYFSRSVVFKILAEFFKFWICYFIGALGGGIVKQIQLSKIAYF